MRRKPGALVPLEASILQAAAERRRRGAREFHGYEIAKHLAAASERKLLTAYGTLYRALGRLENMGLLESRWEDPQLAADENRPGRRLYVLTTAGMEAARAIQSTKAAPEHQAAKRRQRRVAPA